MPSTHIVSHNPATVHPPAGGYCMGLELTQHRRLLFISGQVPAVVNKDAPGDSLEAFGDTKTQTVGVLNRIKGILEGQGLGMGDVVKMQVFLVHNASAPMDFKAFMEGYTQFFGGSQPNLPARSVVGVAALANPGFLVEIEVIAAKDTNKEAK